ncbi:MAG: hypothetical protein ABNH33_10015, partial [Glaciecola sp.]
MTIIEIMSLIGALCLLFVVLKNTKIADLKTDTTLQHRFFGTTVLVFILWIFRAGIVDELYVHFMWLTSLALVLGFRWAIISASLVLLAVTLLGYEHASMLGVNWLAGVAMPIA